MLPASMSEQTSNPSLQIVPATPADVATVLSILEEAVEWLQMRGVHQWHAGDFQEARILRAINAGEVYLAKLGGETVGTGTLTWANTMLWADPGSADAAYLNRMAVRRKHAGKKLGQQIVQWAEREAQKRGKTKLRLDCGEQLATYYEKLGFKQIAHTSVGERTVVLYEKPL